MQMRVEKDDDRDKTFSTRSHAATIPRLKLGPLLSVSPTVYVPFFCIVFLILFLFVIHLPALFLNRGQYLRLSSTPRHAAVFVNGVYRGDTPTTILLPKGEYKIRISLPFFSEYEQTLKTRNIIIARSIAFRKLKIHAQLSLKEKEAYLQRSVESLSEWNFSARSGSRQPLPSLVNDVFSRLKEAAYSFSTTEKYLCYVFRLSRNLLPFLHSLSVLEESETFENMLVKNSYISMPQKEIDTALLSNKTCSLDREKLTLHGRYLWQNIHDTTNWKLRDKAVIKTPLSRPRVIFHDLTFLLVPRGTLFFHHIREKTRVGDFLFLDTSADPHRTSHHASQPKILSVETQPFYILEREVSQKAFARFLAENPQWPRSSEKKISPDDAHDRFKDFYPKTYAQLPMRYISYHDAEAFAHWFDAKMIPLGYRARLPNEFQWRAAARYYEENEKVLLDAVTEDDDVEAVFHDLRSLSSTDLVGSLWEWTSTWHSPLPQFSLFDGPQYGSEKIILGGSYLSKNRMVEGVSETETRNASADPATLSPFLGFRIILLPLKNTSHDASTPPPRASHKSFPVEHGKN